MTPGELAALTFVMLLFGTAAVLAIGWLTGAVSL